MKLQSRLERRLEKPPFLREDWGYDEIFMLVGGRKMYDLTTMDTFIRLSFNEINQIENWLK